MQVGPTLQEGSSGEAVEVLQRALLRAGFDPGPVDGEFGPMTAAQLEASRPREAWLSMASSDLRRGRLLAKGRLPRHVLMRTHRPLS